MAGTTTAWQRGVFWFSLSLCVAVVFLKATANEDAFITFRVIDNLIHGYGLRWNIHERVQVYTHPLWMLINIPLYYVLPNAFLCGIIMGLTCTAMCLYMLFSLCRNRWILVIAALIFIASRALSEYSTSGLENSLGHVLLLAFTCVATSARNFKHRELYLVLLAACAVLNRLDMAVIFGAALFILWLCRHIRFSAEQLLVGSLPVTVWLIFALIYYGSFLPNTYYAKLGPENDYTQTWRQGVEYVRAYFEFDIVGATLLLALLPLNIMSLYRRERFIFALTTGALLQVGYVVMIGGDYMSGRFLTYSSLAGLCCMVLYFNRATLQSALQYFLALVSLVGLCALLNRPMDFGCWVTRSECKEIVRGVQDNWRMTWHEQGLVGERGELYTFPRSRWARDGMNLRASPSAVPIYKGNMGMYPYYAGAQTVFVDMMGLTDPVLARIPVYTTFFTGHRTRHLPRGYLSSVMGDTRMLQPDLQQYVNAIRILTRDPVWNPNRLRTLIAFQRGEYDVYLENYVKSVRSNAP